MSLNFFGFEPNIIPKLFLNAKSVTSPKNQWNSIKPVARYVFRGWQNCIGGVTWYKSWSLFHILHYQNQWGNVCRKIELSSISQRSRLSSTFQEISPLLQRKSSKIDSQGW